MSKREGGKETQARRRAIQVVKGHVLVSENIIKGMLKGAKLTTSTVTNKSKSYFEQTEVRFHKHERRGTNLPMLKNIKNILSFTPAWSKTISFGPHIHST